MQRIAQSGFRVLFCRSSSPDELLSIVLPDTSGLSSPSCNIDPVHHLSFQSMLVTYLKLSMPLLLSRSFLVVVIGL